MVIKDKKIKLVLVIGTYFKSACDSCANLFRCITCPSHLWDPETTVTTMKVLIRHYTKVRLRHKLHKTERECYL